LEKVNIPVVIWPKGEYYAGWSGGEEMEKVESEKRKYEVNDSSEERIILVVGHCRQQKSRPKLIPFKNGKEEPA